MARGFFLAFWDLLGDDLCVCMQQIVDTGFMPQAFSEGLIYLIPKGEGVSDDIRQWRPITILNTVYKIFAKVLSLRLQPLLGELIHDSQTGFVKERSILDNIHLLGGHSSGQASQGGLGSSFTRFRESL